MNENTATFVELPYDPDCTQRQFAQVFALLDRWNAPAEQPVAGPRQRERHDFRSRVVLTAIDAPAREGDPETRRLFQVMSRNVSLEGLGFLSPAVLVPRCLSDKTPHVHCETAFPLGAEVFVDIDPRGQPRLLVRAAVARVRPVDLGFLEIGLRFLNRCGPRSEVPSA